MGITRGEIKSKWIKDLFDKNNESSTLSDSNSIGDSFIWKNTDEGWKFWDLVSGGRESEAIEFYEKNIGPIPDEGDDIPNILNIGDRVQIMSGWDDPTVPDSLQVGCIGYVNKRANIPDCFIIEDQDGDRTHIFHKRFLKKTKKTRKTIDNSLMFEVGEYFSMLRPSTNGHLNTGDIVKIVSIDPPPELHTKDQWLPYFVERVMDGKSSVQDWVREHWLKPEMEFNAIDQYNRAGNVVLHHSIKKNPLTKDECFVKESGSTCVVDLKALEKPNPYNETDLKELDLKKV